ncbi:MAG TPA: phosphate ABC transporter permease PstA [Candidatus Lumbricidophila sp.]|nr:phosphate ABC transporter permease PstA [Candidatus Lumbricidophila sp.]
MTIENPLTAAHLPRYTPWATLLLALLVSGVGFGILAASAGATFNIAGAVVVGLIVYLLVIWLISRRVEGSRRAIDRVMTALVATAFIIALLPLISVAFTTIVNGLPRFDLKFFSSSMRNVVGAGGGAIHAIDGTLLITLAATIISVPIGLLTAIYLVEYGKGPLKRGITFLVDVMTGIPSIVAGLFAFALFSLITGNAGIRFGIGAAVALSVLMIPVVVRSSEEMLKLVPNELREASYALGVPKWLTIVKVVLPTSVAGIVTGVMLAIARVIGETAPLLIIAGFTTSVNTNLFQDRMMTLPVFVFDQYMNQGRDVQAYIDRAWAGALTLILIVALLNIVARVIAKYFSPKTGR